MKNRTHKHLSGFSLVELLVSLAILGILMTAVAVAFDASVTNYQANQAIYRAMNTARQTLLRITNDVRTAQAVAVIGAGGDADNSQLSLLTADGMNVTYRFDATDKILYLVTNDDTTDADYVLGRDITAMTFDRAAITGSSPVAVRNVRIVMTTTDPVTNVSQKMAAAAVVRKNL